ncbi:MAG: HlyD family efflux transporter periplasmic adaptor subunit, partial [Lacipirellulaceae bacterium]
MAKPDRNTLHFLLLRLPFLLLSSIVCICTVTSGCDVSQPSSADRGEAETPEPTRLKVNVAPVTFSEEVFERSIAFGTIKPIRSSSLGFARGGRVAKVRYKVGEFVAEGEVIAELEQEELADQQERLGKSLADAQSQLAAYQSQNNRQLITRAQQDIQRLKAQQTELGRELSKGLIVAPYRCQLAEINVTAGDMVPSGRPYFQILEDAPPVIEVNLPIAQASQTKVGDTVWIKRDEQLRPATVASKSPELDASSRTRLATLNLPGLGDDANGENDTEESVDWTIGEVVEVHSWNGSKNTG